MNLNELAKEIKKLIESDPSLGELPVYVEGCDCEAKCEGVIARGLRPFENILLTRDRL